MALPPFATVDDLDARLPDGVGDNDVTRAEAALTDASTLIRAVAGKTWVDDSDELEDPLPDILLTVCCRAAARSFTNPEAVSQETTGPFGVTYSNASSDVYLTKAERDLIRQAAGGTRLGVWTLPTTRLEGSSDTELREVDGCIYLAVEGSEKMVPYRQLDDV